MFDFLKIIKQKKKITLALPMPIIVGEIRSGTTLLRLMLDAHPNLAIPPETSFDKQLFQKLKTTICKDEFIKMLQNSKKWNDIDIDIDLLTQELGSSKEISGVKGLNAFYRTYASQCGKYRYGDKSPGYIHYMTLINEVLPEARFIHIIRDGRDVTVSQNQALVGLYSNKPKEIINQANSWVKKIQIARQQAKNLKFYKEIFYEDLILDTYI